MKEYTTISTLVKSGNKYRIFQTQAYSIRALCIILTRYSPQAEIITVKYGDFDCPCPNWDDTYQPCDEENSLPIHTKFTREELLRQFDYRTAINIHYAKCHQTGKYPSKSPFKGVRPWNKEEFKHEVNKHPFFIKDEENDMGSDILKYYEGKRIDRLINGEEVYGYYLTSARIIKENAEEDEE